MELDELKIAWSKYDEKLNKNLILNERLLKNMNMEKAKKEMQNPLVIEILEIVVSFIVVAFLIASSIRLIEEIRFSLTGFIAAMFGLIHLIFAIITVNRFLKIDYYNSNIIKLQKEISQLKTLILRLRKVELTMVPIFFITLFPILFKTIKNKDVFENPLKYGIKIFIGLGICYSIILWANKHFYYNKIKHAEMFLEEIEDFEKEK